MLSLSACANVLSLFAPCLTATPLLSSRYSRVWIHPLSPPHPLRPNPPCLPLDVRDTCGHDPPMLAPDCSFHTSRMDGRCVPPLPSPLLASASRKICLTTILSLPPPLPHSPALCLDSSCYPRTPSPSSRHHLYRIPLPVRGPASVTFAPPALLPCNHVRALPLLVYYMT